MERRIMFTIEVTTDLSDEELTEYVAYMLRVVPYDVEHSAEWMEVEQ